MAVSAPTPIPHEGNFVCVLCFGILADYLSQIKFYLNDIHVDDLFE